MCYQDKQSRDVEPEPSFTLVPHEPSASFKKEEEQIEIVNAKNNPGNNQGYTRQASVEVSPYAFSLDSKLLEITAI